MSSDPQPPPEATPPESRELQDLVLDLDFIPTWARKPAEHPYAGAQVREERAPARSGRFSNDQRDRGAPRSGPGGPRPGGRRKGPPRGGRDGRDSRDGGSRMPMRPPPVERLPLDIQFIPERRQLGAVVKQMFAAQKCYPLPYVAGLFLGKPEFHMLKVELRPGRAGGLEAKLYQCGPDGALFADLEALKAHAIARHLDEFYVSEDVQTEPPAGNFNCVGRCRASGELLGPPNYHGYNERLMDLHRTRFAHLKLDDYRAQVEIVRDPAVVEQWKESCRTQRVYRPKDQPESAPLKREEAVALFVQKQLPAMVRTGNRFVVPGESVRELRAGPLRSAIEEAWDRENRFPLSLMLALRPAFKRMRLHLFKAGRNETFVTAIPPRALDAMHAVEPIRAMLQLIHQHPGWNRAQLVEHLKPGTAPGTEAAAELLNPLRWLIEKGHVIEFFNGTLSAPAETGTKDPAPASPPAPVAAPASVEPEPEPAPVPEAGDLKPDA
jgi:hypothetical protein